MMMKRLALLALAACLTLGAAADAVPRRVVSLIPATKYEMMEGTGHIGLVTQPDRFARIVGTFVNANNP